VCFWKKGSILETDLTASIYQIIKVLGVVSVDKEDMNARCY
jgi:hypothetical protein